MPAAGPAPTDLAATLLRVESLAARLEAHTTADPALGRLWRSEAALTEAVRSVGLEDVAVREDDLVAKLAETRVTGPEGQGIAAARDVLRGLQAPGDLIAWPPATLDRLARTGRFGDAARGQALAPTGAPEATARRMGVDGEGQGAGARDRHLLDGLAVDLAASRGGIVRLFERDVQAAARGRNAGTAGRTGAGRSPRIPVPSG